MNKYVNCTTKFLKKNKNKIMFASGIAGTVATGVTGVQAGIRIERKRARMEAEKGPLSKKDILKLAAPELIPVALSCSGSVILQSANFISLSNKIEAISTTAAGLASQLEKIKTAEKDILGEEKASEIQKAAVEAPSVDIRESPTGKVWFQDFYTNAEYYTTEAAIEKAIGHANKQLTWCDISANDLAMYIDKADSNNLYSPMGDEIGWECGTELQVRYTDGHLANNTPCRVIMLNNRPRCLKKRAFDW